VSGPHLSLYSRPVVNEAGPNRLSGDFERFGAIAQLGERFNGIEEVVGSIPSGSTNQSLILLHFWSKRSTSDISAG
jgi:hypothetical protein